MRRARTGRWLRTGLGALITLCVAFVAVSYFVELRYAGRIRSRAEVPQTRVALVFGAGLAAGGVPSPVLRQRLDAALGLYRAGKVKKLLVSGDNTDRYHDETKAMRRYAIDRGIPAADVIGDYAGVSTYDTCYRAREIFGLEHAVLVTQEFHLPRALYLANSLGIDSWGVPADPGAKTVWKYELRELFARAAAVYLALRRPPARILGERVVLPTDGPSDVAVQ